MAPRFLEAAALAESLHLSPDLRTGRRALESLSGFESLAPFYWHAKVERWVLSCRFRIPELAGSPIPVESDWYLVVAQEYPRGEISLYPAKQGGITTTYPHQAFNEVLGDDFLWRNGKLCLATQVSSIQREIWSEEPRDAQNRLAWHIERAKIWLHLAAQGRLSEPGDLFELPEYPRRSDLLVAFDESAESLEHWRAAPSHGLAETGQLFAQNPRVLVVRSFADVQGEVFYRPSWGNHVENLPEGAFAGWIRFPGTIFLQPWQAPDTWKELKHHLLEQGIDLRPLLIELASVSAFRDRKQHPLLLGFPVSRRVGEEAVRMHWLAVELPALLGMELRGFRENAIGTSQKIQRLLQGPIRWARSSSWSKQELQGRGGLPGRLPGSRIILLGAGALGSALAELLVRGGVHHISIMDSESLEAGNLVRHTLTLEEIERPKAEMLAQRLNSLSPHAKVEYLQCRFPEVSAEAREAISTYDLVIDATADDGALGGLEHYQWETPRTFVSLSLGLSGRRLYCFSDRGLKFPGGLFENAIRPYLEQDWAGVLEDELPREGLGCWNPKIPLAVQDLWLLAGAAVKWLAEIVAGASKQPSFVVIEQKLEKDRFQGLRVTEHNLSTTHVA